jgi:hypothetical protein
MISPTAAPITKSTTKIHFRRRIALSVGSLGTVGEASIRHRWWPL